MPQNLSKNCKCSTKGLQSRQLEANKILSCQARSKAILSQLLSNNTLTQVSRNRSTLRTFKNFCCKKARKLLAISLKKSLKANSSSKTAHLSRKRILVGGVKISRCPSRPNHQENRNLKLLINLQAVSQTRLKH